MPQIAQYARQGHVSSFVGVAPSEGKSQALAIAAEGVSGIQSVLQKQALATGKQQAATASYQAQEMYYKNLAGSPDQQGLADQFASNPQALPDEAVKMGNELFASMGTGIDNDIAKNEYNKIMDGFLIGERRRLTFKAIEQNQANQVAAMNDGAQILSNSAAVADGEEGVTQVIQGLFDNQFLIDATEDGVNTANISQKVRQQGFESSVTDAKRNFISGQLDRNPVKFAQELNAGKYQTLQLTEDTSVPFISTKEAKTIISDAESITKNRQDQFNFDFAMRNGEIGIQLAEMDSAGQLTYTEVDNLEFQARKEGQTKIADMYGSFKDSLLKGNDSNRITDRQWYILRMEELEQMEEKVGGFFGIGSGPRVKPIDQVDRVFDIIRETNDKFAKGELTKSDRNAMMKKLQVYNMSNIGAMKANKSPYYIGMNEIKEAINAQKMSDIEKVNALYAAYADYDQALSIANLDGEETLEQTRGAAQSALRSIAYRLNPSRGSLKEGSVVTTPTGPKQVKGFDEFGNPTFVEVGKQDFERLNAK